MWERRSVDQLTCPLPAFAVFVFPRHLGEHGYLIEGAVTLSKEILDKYIPYKYWVTCGKGDYEFIYKTPESSEPVNRCLLVKKALLKDGGELCWLDLPLGVIPVAQHSCQTALSGAGSSVGCWGCCCGSCKREGT